jgi:hypothetical protein
MASDFLMWDSTKYFSGHAVRAKQFLGSILMSGEFFATG